MHKYRTIGQWICQKHANQLPTPRGENVRWNNFLDVLPHPQGLGPLFTGTN